MQIASKSFMNKSFMVKKYNTCKQNVTQYFLVVKKSDYGYHN